MTVEAPEREPITARQREVYDWVVEFVETKGYSPTFRELQQAFGFGSTNAVVCHILPLKRRGWLTWNEGQSRTLRPIGGLK